MVIGLFGESCTGKSSVAELLKKQLGAQFYSGKDYLRLVKNPPDAERSFAELLREHVDSDDLNIACRTFEQSRRSFLENMSTQTTA